MTLRLLPGGGAGDGVPRGWRGTRQPEADGPYLPAIFAHAEVGALLTAMDRKVHGAPVCPPSQECAEAGEEDTHVP